MKITRIIPIGLELRRNHKTKKKRSKNYNLSSLKMLQNYNSVWQGEGSQKPPARQQCCVINTRPCILFLIPKYFTYTNTYFIEFYSYLYYKCSNKIYKTVIGRHFFIIGIVLGVIIQEFSLKRNLLVRTTASV